MVAFNNIDLATQAALRFYPDTFAESVSQGTWKPFDYHRIIGRAVADAVYRGRGRLLITAPPRHVKSYFLSWWTPTWFLDNWPEKKVILGSYGQELASTWGRKCRNTFNDTPGLATRLAEDSKAAGRWNTPQGGGMMCVGVEGSIIGFGGDLILLDDPHKNWDEGNSPTMLQKAWDWFNSTLYSRQEPNATIIVYAHRFNTKDLIGRLASEHPDTWTLLDFPALAEKNDLLGRSEGEALCPSRFNEDWWDRQRKASPKSVWSAMYQQMPEAGKNGRVYHRYRPAKHNRAGLPLRTDIPLQMSFDFNVNPGMHALIGQCDYKNDLITTVFEIFGERMKTPEVMDVFEKFVIAAGGWQWPCLEIYGDRSGKTENTQTTITDYMLILAKLKHMGIKVRFKVPDANPPIKARVMSVLEALEDSQGKVHWLIDHLNCPRLINDMEQMMEDEKGLPSKEDQELSHPSEAEGYRIHSVRPTIARMLKDRNFNIGGANASRMPEIRR